MKGPTRTVVALAALATLSACGQTAAGGRSVGSASQPTTSQAPTPAPTAATRLQNLYDAAAGIFAKADEVDDSADPHSAGAANRLLGLGDDAPVRFAEFLVRDEGGGRFCLESDDDTYLAMTEGAAPVVLIGNGSCSYAADDAAVVGDVMADVWIKGARLMHDRNVRGLFPDSEGPEDDQPTRLRDDAPERLRGEARAVAFSIEMYAASTGRYPRVGPADLISAVSQVFAVQAGPHTRVHTYRATRSGYGLCLADEDGWVRWDSTTIGEGGSTSAMHGGSYDGRRELDLMCAIPAHPTAARGN